MRWTSCGSHGFDALHQFIQGEEVAEIHLLPRQVRHPAGGGFQARASATLSGGPWRGAVLRRHRVLLEFAELLHDRFHHLSRRFDATFRHKSTGIRCRDTDSARRTPRTPVPAARGCSGTAASSFRRPAAYSGHSRRSAPRAAADRTARPGTDAPAPATFLLRSAMRAWVAGSLIRRRGDRRRQRFEVLRASATSRSCVRFPAAVTIRLAARRRLSSSSGSSADRTA